MSKYIVIVHGPTCGMDGYYAIESNNIEQDGLDIALDHLESYGYYYDPEEEDNYENAVSEVDFSYEEYDSEKHDMYRSGGGSFEDDF